MRMFWSFVVPHSSDYVCAVMLLRFFAIFVDTWLSAVRVEILLHQARFCTLDFDFFVCHSIFTFRHLKWNGDSRYGGLCFSQDGYLMRITPLLSADQLFISWTLLIMFFCSSTTNILRGHEDGELLIESGSLTSCLGRLRRYNEIQDHFVYKWNIRWLSLRNSPLILPNEPLILTIVRFFSIFN